MKIYDLLESGVWIFLLLLTIAFVYAIMTFACILSLGMLGGFSIGICKMVSLVGTVLIVVVSFIKVYLENRE